MSNKYLITGVAGTGKSSVAKELQKRGYAAHDVDSGFSYWVDKSTGKQVSYPNNPTLEWYEKHERVFNETVLEDIFNRHKNESVFICSLTANQQRYYPQFDKIFLLILRDKNILIHRINTRINSPYGKHPVELSRILTRQEEYDNELRSLGAIDIDSTQSISKIADEIIGHVGNDHSSIQ